MVDPAAIAAAVAALLARKALEGASGEAGKAAWSALARLADAVRSRFAGDAEVEEALDRLDDKPESGARAAEVAKVLEGRLQEDHESARELERLVVDARTTGVRIVATDAGIVTGGDVTLTTSGGGDVVGRDKIGGAGVGGDGINNPPPSS